jgi:hypothetical protein
MPTIVELPDRTQIEFPDGMDEATIQSEINKAYPGLAPKPEASASAPLPVEPEPTVSLRPSVPAPGESNAGVEFKPLSPVPQAFPAIGQDMAQSQADQALRTPRPEKLTDETISAAVRQEPPLPEAEIQPIGEPGTVLRGASSVVASVLNRPEYLAALMNPATAAAVAIGFGPQVVKQFTEDVGLAAKGDREAFGRALAIGLPVAVGVVKSTPNIRGGIDVKPFETAVDLKIAPNAPATAEALKSTSRELRVEPPAAEVAARAPEQPDAVEVIKPVEETVAVEPAKSAELQAPKTEEVQEIKPVTEPAIAEAPSSATGIKNATVEKERAARGLPPAIEPARREFGTVWDEAMAKIERNPAVQEKLISELREKPRSLTDAEDAILLHRQIELQNEYGKATKEVTQAFDEGRLADAEASKARVADLSNQLLDLYDINKKSGTETGRGLAARRMMANEDFTLARMETDLRVAKGGKPLTDAERMEATRIASEFERVNKELETALETKTRELSEAQMARTMAEMQASALREQTMISPQVKRIVDRVGQVLDTRADAARKRLAGKLFSISPDVLKDLAEIGAANIYHIGLDLAKWSSNMVADLGEAVKPHLEKVWEASQRLMDQVTDATAGKVTPEIKTKAKERLQSNATPEQKVEKLTAQITERVTAGDKSVSPLVQKLARAFVESGIKEREVLIDKVHEVMTGLIPEWTRRETMDAISGYGNLTRLKKDEASVRLRDLKGQMQQLAKLEDMAASVPPLKTGVERRTPSEAEKALIKAINEAKREGNYQTTDPTTQLSSALDQVKSRMRTEIAELERKIRENDFSKKTPQEIKLDKDALDAQFKLKQLRDQWAEKLFEKKLAEETVAKKALRWTGEVLNTMRALITSGEFSAVLRQGRFVMHSHPVIGAKALPEMFRAFGSKKEAFKAELEIKKRPNYPLYQRSKLYLAEEGTSLSKMEEAYMSRWSKKIPIVAGSSRAYSTFLNRIRADSFDAMASTLARGGKPTLAEASTIANFVNVATGRGGLAVGEKAAVGLSTVFFAPRFVASRFQMLLGQPLLYGIASGKAPLASTLKVRALIASEYARILAGYAVYYSLAKLAWPESKVGSESNATDLGKVVVGDTRIDPLAGLSQVTVLLSRLSTGEKATNDGKVRKIRGDIGFGDVSAAGVIGTFLRTKLAPVPGNVIDVLAGENVIGEPVTPKSVAMNLTVPITYRDILDLMEEQGIPRATAMQILAIFGESVNTYTDRKK